MRFAIRLTIVAACLVFVAATVSAQATVQIGGAGSLTFKGFISATAFAQDQNFAVGNGQNAEYPVGAECEVDCWFGGADIRNTRLTMVFEGPKVVGDWKVGGTLEMDFFGGFNGTATFSGQQPNPRLRLGFIDFTNGSTTIRMGQQWAPLFGYTAVSLSHIAFPLGWGSAGDIGWRFPGLFVYQTLTPKDSVVNADLQIAVMSGSWNGPDCGTTTNCVNDLTAGHASWPQFELRVNVGGKLGDAGTWSGYIAGHIDEKDLSGAGAATPHDKLTGSAVEVGAKVQIGPVLIQGNAYTGHSIGQQFAMITQFGKIQGQGGWAQLGFDITKNWSVFGFFGIDDPKNIDVLHAVGAAGRMKNEMYAGMLRWKSGPLAFGLEYMHDRLRTGALEVKTDGNQLALSALYNF
jgi:hypothetical protein